MDLERLKFLGQEDELLQRPILQLVLVPKQLDFKAFESLLYVGRAPDVFKHLVEYFC